MAPALLLKSLSPSGLLLLCDIDEHHVLALEGRAILERAGERQDPYIIVCDWSQGAKHILGHELQVEVVVTIRTSGGALVGAAVFGDGSRVGGGYILDGYLAPGLRLDLFLTDN